MTEHAPEIIIPLRFKQLAKDEIFFHVPICDFEFEGQTKWAISHDLTGNTIITTEDGIRYKAELNTTIVELSKKLKPEIFSPEDSNGN